MIILVTGSRTWTDFRVIYDAFSYVNMDVYGVFHVVGECNITLRHGGAKGADLMSAQAASQIGWKVEPPFKPDWDKHGLAAGFIRNQEMIDTEPKPGLCLSFMMSCTKPSCKKANPHPSHGAADCAERAERAGIPTRRYLGYKDEN